MGNVGKLVVDCLKVFNFDVICCDPLRAQQEPDFVSTPLEDLKDLDLISIHVPLTKDGAFPTYHFIDEAFLKRQKLGCVLINASRGAVINSSQLMQAGAHLHWCFDVWEHEPTIDKTLLENVLLATPHIAGYSVQSKMRGIDMIYRKMIKLGLISGQDQPIAMPRQQLRFAGEKHHWQDLLLGIFNPMIMTAMMRSTLMPVENYGPLFDEMRHQFTYRHEFAFTDVCDVALSGEDLEIVRKLGIGIL